MGKPNRSQIVFVGGMLLFWTLFRGNDLTTGAFGQSVNSPPVAVAGPSRYVSRAPITLDGSDSYDPDGHTPLFYQWRQLSGPPLSIGSPHTARPTISGFAPTDDIQTCIIELVVGDGGAFSEPDTLEIIIVPDYETNPLHLKNPPFNPELPTIIAFGGGDCECGQELVFGQPSLWHENANLISGGYCPPYTDQGNMAIVLLSELAPDYRQPIQMIGFSTGNNPAAVAANHINETYDDPRYAVNRLTLLDATCQNINYRERVSRFTLHPVNGEPAWVDNYTANAPFQPASLNVRFPSSVHMKVYEWFRDSALSINWPNEDPYHQGITAGYYLSVAGPCKNMRLAPYNTFYSFVWDPGTFEILEFADFETYPGRLPQAVTLKGPADGTLIGESGALLSCAPSKNALNYQLLFGPDPDNLSTIVSETSSPPAAIIRNFPFNPTFWTVKVFDAFGTSVHADPLSLYTSTKSRNPILTSLRPRHGSTVKGAVGIHVDAKDGVGINKVKFFVDGRLHHTALSPPYSCTWDTIAEPQGKHILRATAINRRGRSSSVQSRVMVANMSLMLRGERKLERSWILKKPYADLVITLDNPGAKVAVSQLMIYRMDPGDPFSLLADTSYQETGGNDIPFIDPTIPSERTSVYKVEARDENGRVIARSNFLIL